MKAQSNNVAVILLLGLTLVAFSLAFFVFYPTFIDNPQNEEETKSEVSFVQNYNSLEVSPTILEDTLIVKKDGNTKGKIKKPESSITIVGNASKNKEISVEVYTENEEKLVQRTTFIPEPRPTHYFDLVELNTSEANVPYQFNYAFKIRNKKEATLPEASKLRLNITQDNRKNTLQTRLIRIGETYRVSRTEKNLKPGMKDVTLNIINPGQNPNGNNVNTIFRKEKVRVYSPTNHSIVNVKTKKNGTDLDYNLTIKNNGIDGKAKVLANMPNAKADDVQIYFVIDESGSMGPVIDGVSKGIKNYIDGINNTYNNTVEVGAMDIESSTGGTGYTSPPSPDFTGIGRVKESTTDVNSIKSFIGSLSAGGSNEPMFGGLSRIAKSSKYNDPSKQTIGVIVSNENQGVWFGKGAGPDSQYESIVNNPTVGVLCFCRESSRTSGEHFRNNFDSSSGVITLPQTSNKVKTKLEGEVKERTEKIIDRFGQTKVIDLKFGEKKYVKFTLEDYKQLDGNEDKPVFETHPGKKRGNRRNASTSP